jgi:hypothetical protein
MGEAYNGALFTDYISCSFLCLPQNKISVGSICTRLLLKYFLFCIKAARKLAYKLTFEANFTDCPSHVQDK